MSDRVTKPGMLLGALVFVPNMVSGQVLEELVVTAKQREQNLQEVPLSITAFSADQIREKALSDPRDLARFTPNFNFYAGTGRQDPSELSIRGLSPNTTDERYQGVSFFLDGVPISGNIVGLPLFNLERVEVIKGPQSATFGRSTYSGAVNYITRDPEVDTVAGEAVFRWADGARSAEDSHLASGFLEFPILANQLWASVGFTQSVRGALGRDLATGEPLGREKTRAWSGTVLYRPYENFSIRLRVNYDREDDSHAAVYVQHPRSWVANNTTTVLPQGDLWTTRVADPDVSAAGCEPRFVVDRLTCDAERDRLFASWIVTREMSSGASWSYSGGYLNQDVRAPLDATFAGSGDPLFSDVPTPVKPASLFFVSPRNFYNTSHQLIYLSPSNNDLTWRVGTSYLYERTLNYGLSGGAAGPTPTNPKGQRTGALWSRFIAGFGAVDWQLSQAWALALEGRLERDTVGFDACTFCFTATSEDRSESSLNFLPRFTAQYRLNDDILLYGLFAYGTKIGRYNDTVPPNFPFAEKEKLYNYELGAKTSLWEGRAILNIAVFYQDVKDQQFRAAVPGTIQQFIQNVGSSDIWGFELESAARVTERLSATLAVGYAKHEYKSAVSLNESPISTRIFFPAGQANLLGLTTINTPRLTGAASMTYTAPITSTTDLRARLDYSYRGKTFVDTGNIARTPVSHRVNARLSYGTDLLEATIFVNNLTNDGVALGSRFGAAAGCFFTAPELDTPQRCLHAAIPRPREIGIELRAKF